METADRPQAAETSDKGVTALPPSPPSNTNVEDRPAGTNGGTPDFTWHRDAFPGPQTHELCELLAGLGTLFKTTTGRIVKLDVGSPPRSIADPTDLEAVIRENFKVRVVKGGKPAGSAIPSADLRVLLRSLRLMEKLPTVDRVTDVPTYNSSWQLTEPGYNDGGAGDRIFYTGARVAPRNEPVLIRRFLAAMPFKAPADAANCVAFALTVLLRWMWPGAKPFVALTANKSHAGKDTAAAFAAGRTRMTEVSWHRADWALQNECVAALADPNVGLIVVGNVRSGGSAIESSFLERTVTSSTSRLQSSKRRGDGYVRDGDFLFCATANQGRFSADIANRALPINLELVGDVSNRESGIGDPRHGFLPEHRDEIEAEICGLVENWRDQGCPLDTAVRHPMKAWAATIGGILKTNGFMDFLANWTLQRNLNDTIRESIGIIALASAPDRWLRVETLLNTAIDEGVLPALMEPRHLASSKAMMRQLGVVMAAHRDETFHVETDDGVRVFTLRRDRNTSSGQLATVYRFEHAAAEVSEQVAPSDDEVNVQKDNR